MIGMTHEFEGQKMIFLELTTCLRLVGLLSVSCAALLLACENGPPVSPPPPPVKGDDTGSGYQCVETDDCDGDNVSNFFDCDDRDPNAFQLVYPDEDGDGYRLAGKSGFCVGENLPDHTTLNDENDCDDTDRETWWTICLDQDGDGYCRSETLTCGGDTWPAGYILHENRYDDCDDMDSQLQRYGYEDRDGDRERSVTPTLCLPEDYPERYVFEYGADCDDENPLIATYRPDLFEDGVDSNCDGQDGFEQICDPNEPWNCDCRQENETDESETLSTTCPDGIDLSLIDMTTCGGYCLGHSVYITIANQGGVAMSGEILIVYTSHSINDAYVSISPESASPEHLQTTISVTLSPGEFRHVVIDPECRGVSVQALYFEDCYPYNNAAVVKARDISHCE